MTFQEFTARMTEAVQERYGSEAEVMVRRIQKDNGLVLTGISVSGRSDLEGAVIQPVVYLEPYYDKANEGVPVHRLARMLCEVYDEARNIGISVDPDMLLSYDTAKEHLYCRMMDVKQNKERLAGMPHEDWQDLAVTYFVDAGSGSGDTGIVQVTDSLMEKWGVTGEDLKADAWKNMLENRPLRLRPLGSVLGEMTGEKASHMVDSPLYVLDNGGTMFGAIGAAYPDMAKEAVRQFGRNFYMLPSSIHEFLLLPDDGNYEAEGIERLVRSINSTEVQEQDYLSDRVYYCNAKTQEIQYASDYERQKKAQLSNGHPEVCPALGL